MVSGWPGTTFESKRFVVSIPELRGMVVVVVVVVVVRRVA
jgi:hypothetical protein